MQCRMNSLDGLSAASGRFGPFTVDEQSDGNLDLALVTGVVKLVSESGSHFVVFCKVVR